MAKRPSIVGDLELTPAAPVEAPAAEPAQKTAEVVSIKSQPKAAKARDVQHTSVYIPREAYERLREIAFTERKKVHDLIMEGVENVIRARGHSESARRKPKAS